MPTTWHGKAKVLETKHQIIRLTRDLTIEDFSDIDLSDITFDDYRSSMESLTKARDKSKLKTLLPRRRAPISRYARNFRC